MRLDKLAEQRGRCNDRLSRPATATVVVVVVNWNGRRFLGPCLESLARQRYRHFQVVVVDNGSTDGSASFVRESFPRVRLIANEENRGFAAANNQAIRATTSEFVVTLNNDTEAAPEWLAELVKAVDARSAVGACASRMLFAHRPEVINSAGIAIDRAAIAWDWRGGELDDLQEVEPVEVFGACAGAALYRRAMLEEIGLFDEDFFAYLEDVDLAWRGQWAGWRALSVPTARVLHHHSSTAVEGSPFKNRLLGRNKVWLIAKNYPWPHLVWYLPLIALYDVASLPYTMIAKGDWQPVLGRLEGLAASQTALRKRGAVRAVSKASGRELLSRMARFPWPYELWSRYAHLRGGALYSAPHQNSS